MKLFGFNITRDAALSEPLVIPNLSARVSGAPDRRLVPGAPSDFSGRRASGERTSMETLDVASGFDIWNSYANRKDNARLGLGATFDIEDFSQMDFDVLAELLAELSPEVSKAVWDFLLLCNSGYELKAYRPGGEEIDEAAQGILDEMMAILDIQNGSTGVFFDRLFKMIFLRGSFLMELILQPNGRDFAGIATPDTKTLSFRRVNDPVRGQIWDFGQRQAGDFVSLDLPNIVYIPIHPNPDSIEGRALCSAAFFSALFLMSILRDTKRVVQHQGYLRLDVAIDFDKLIQTMPADIASNPEEVAKWMNEIVEAVRRVYEQLEPDDTYIHSNVISVNDPVGTISADALQGMDSLFQALERMLTRSLKSMPLMMGNATSRSETQANREWEIYAKGIETIQHFVESAFERIARLRLRAAGVQADVKLRFAQFRAAEQLRDAQVDMLKTAIARTNYDNGYISQDEAANYAVGKDVADAPEPRNQVVPPDPNALNGANENPNPGESRFTHDIIRDAIATIRMPSLTEIDAAEKVLKTYAPDLLTDLFDAKVADDGSE